MATARKSGASRPKAKPVKTAKVAVAKRAGSKPAARTAGKPSPAKAVARPSVAKPAARPVAGKPGPPRPVLKGGKPAPVAAKDKAMAGKPGVVGKPAVAGKARVIGKPAVTGKPGVVGKPAVAGKARVIGKPAVAGKPGVATKNSKGKFVTVASPGVLFKRAGKPVIRVVSHGPIAQARPIGALPPEAVARAVKGHGPIVAKPGKPVRPSRETKHPAGVEGVSEKDFKEFEERLIAERQKLMKDIGYLETNVLKVNQRDSSGDLSGYSFHMADVGTDAYEREKAFLFASSEGRLLIDIDDALRKLYRGEYGKCEICEQPIARARLEAMPAARLCLSCKEKQERESRGAQ